jgi:hypothetical protein
VGAQVRVLAIDPGLKTGVALFDADAQQLRAMHIVPGGLPGLQDWWELHRQALEWDVLVVESFELEEGTHGIDLTPVGIIDWFKTLGIPIVWQRRNQRGKGKLISVPVLKRAGLYPKRGELKEGHQVAALQHALAYLVRQRHLPTIRLLHPPQE